MAEAFGAVSSAVQLAALCHSLLRLTRRMKGASSTIQGYQAELQEIRVLATSISHNPLLQTREIEALTGSVLAMIQGTNLKAVLQKRRLFRTIFLFCNEEKLRHILEAIERQKLSLCLGIGQIQSTALYEIKREMEVMGGRRPRLKAMTG